MRGTAQRDGRPLGGSELRSYFSSVVDQSTPNVCLRGSVRSLQRRFPIDNVLLRCGGIRDQVAKLFEIAPNFDVLGPPNFGGGTSVSDRML